MEQNDREAKDEEIITQIVKLIKIELQMQTPTTPGDNTRRFLWDTLFAKVLDENRNQGFQDGVPQRIKEGVLKRLVDNQIVRKEGDEIVFTHT